MEKNAAKYVEEKLKDAVAAQDEEDEDEGDEPGGRTREQRAALVAATARDPAGSVALVEAKKERFELQLSTNALS